MTPARVPTLLELARDIDVHEQSVARLCASIDRQTALIALQRTLLDGLPYAIPHSARRAETLRKN
jgi:hypothetical protein